MSKQKTVSIEDIKQEIKLHYNETNTDIIDLAFEYAKKAHEGQMRTSGEPYFNHPIRTAYTLAQWGLDIPTITAGLLHDVPEDTELTINDIYTEFGKEIANLVEGITKLGTIKYRGYRRYAENIRKMFVAMASDIRTVFIKFADRIDNLHTLNVLPLVKQQRIAKESLEIYSPIAHRLGMGYIRGEIEDLAFPYAYPVAYTWLEQISQDFISRQSTLVGQYIKETEKLLKENEIEYSKIYGRSKRKYSLYRKLLRPKYNKDINQIYDLVALRIIIPKTRNCYLVLGLVNNHWPPLPNRIKDYISQPKPNGYRSLHTTVFSNKGLPIEFQIRTPEMDDFAEYGLAAHWHYKQNEESTKNLTKNKKWLKQLAEWQKDIENDRNYIKSLKLDIFMDRIFVFTPKGDVIDLPEGSTSIDFAYHIHSDIGNQCGGAKINSKLSGLNKPLCSGDIVEIIINRKRESPSEDWLNVVKTQTAKDKIKSALRRSQGNFINRLLNR